MFAKQAQIALAAIALTAAAGAFAQSPERNVFDSEAILQLPAAQSADGLTREAVRDQYLAERSAKNISSFRPEAWRQAEIAGAGEGFVALFKGRDASKTAVAAGGKTRDEVRGEFLAARAKGELNPFDTETYQRVGPTLRQPYSTNYAQR
jgi:hypothetical protein